MFKNICPPANSQSHSHSVTVGVHVMTWLSFALQVVEEAPQPPQVDEAEPGIYII